LRSVRLADPILAFVHQEVHVDAGLVRFERRPQASRPFPLLVEPFRRFGDRCDVDRVARAKPVEGGFVLGYSRDSASLLKDRESRLRRTHSEGVVGGDVDHLVSEFGDVAGADVVLPAVQELLVEHCLEGEEGQRPAEIEER